jgi:cholesterol oxidase
MTFDFSPSRRRLLGAAAGLPALGLGGPARAGGLDTAMCQLLVPELFAPVPRAPAHVRNLVIGSGFGGAVSALRLAQAGEEVAVLERGLRWPNSPWRPVFAGETAPDGRAFWFKPVLGKGSPLNLVGLDTPFAGVMDETVYDHMRVLRGACVGGGSVVFSGVMIQPQRRYFDDIFGGLVDYDEMDRVYWPRVRAMLGLSPMPADIYRSDAFGHSRAWDDQVRRAGYLPQPADSIFNWKVVRQELQGRCLPSATIGLSNWGNSNGAKFDLNQNYLRQAEATGRARIYPAHQVHAIGFDGSRYTVDTSRIRPDGRVLERYVLTCDRLFLAAGSVGTSELLVKAQAQGTLRELDAQTGQGWGSNGDVVTTRTLSAMRGLTQGAPCASLIQDATSGLPLTLENWYAPLVTLDLGIVRSLAMVYDATHRGRFRYDASADRVVLDWNPSGNDDAVAVVKAVNDRIADASRSMPGLEPLIPGVSGKDWTAHPLGGAVLGRVTDGHGRVKGHRGLYVMDGAAVPGSCGAVNPSLTIAALAERNVEAVLRAGA